MKRVFFVLVIFCLLLAGCNSEPQQATEPAEAVTVVNTVDEFLAAIAPGATIELGEGEFNLSSAADYGDRVGPYYTWEELGMEQYSLKLQYLEGLTIRGQGKDRTKLVTDPRWAHVLTLMDCENVVISDMTLGHTEMADACEGGVIHLGHSDRVSLQNLGLFGCGTIGVWAYSCDTVEVADCEIYDCSGSGISLSQCRNVKVRGSELHSLGKEVPVQSCFDIWSSRNVQVMDCVIRDNYVNTLVYVGLHSEVSFSGNTFRDSQVARSGFSFDEETVVFDNNTFENIGVRSWYQDHPAVDPEGKPVAFPEPEKAPAGPGVAQEVATGEQKEIHVKTADQFLSAIGPDRKIILDADIDLSTATAYGYEVGEYYYWEDIYDGPALVINSVTNMTIEGAGEDRKARTISAVPRYANVLTFDGCFAVTLKNLTAGHTVAPGECMGGVLLFRYSDSLLVENCGLYGCGTYGVQTEQSPNLQIVNCEIYECSYGGVWLQSSENISISGTTFRDLGGPVFNLWDCVNVTVDGVALDGNYSGD